MQRLRDIHADKKNSAVIFSPLLSPMMVLGAQGLAGSDTPTVLPSQTARYQTLDRGLRPGPELFWETKNGSEISTQGRTPHKMMAWRR